MNAQASVYWLASGRNGYWAVDEHHAGSSGTYGSALIFKRRMDAESVAGALCSAYQRGLATAVRDSATLDQLAKLLSAREWDAHLCEPVVHLITATGREVTDPNDG
jgi:hypothetical protein